MLVRGLPADSSVARAVEGERAIWSVTDHLLAVVADRVADLIWLTVEVNKKKGAANPRPEPIPRPGAAKSNGKRRHATVAEMKRFFGKG